MAQTRLAAVYLPIFIAYLLLFLPWTEQANQYKPDFVLLVLIFWLIRAPQRCNIGTAWIVGIFVDIATGGILGQHALAYTFSAYFTVLYQRRLILFNAFHLFWTVFMLLLIAQVVMLVLQMFAGLPFPGWDYFYPSISGVLLWSISMLFRLHTDGRPGEL